MRTIKEANDAIKNELLNELYFKEVKIKNYNFEYKRAIVEKKEEV